MIALIKLIIVLVLSVFSGEPAEEKITENSQYLELLQEQKIDMLSRCSKTCLAS